MRSHPSCRRRWDGKVCCCHHSWFLIPDSWFLIPDSPFLFPCISYSRSVKMSNEFILGSISLILFTSLLDFKHRYYKAKFHSHFYRGLRVKFYGGPKVSWQFQFAHGNFNLLAAISICSRQFQFAPGSFNLLTAVSISLTAISICSRQLSSSMGNSEVRCEVVNYICHLAN